MARYTVGCALRWSDLDLFGHVNNARFLTLYEEARVALLFTDARDAGITSLEDGVVIARHEIDYLRPVDFIVESGPNFAGSARPDRRVRIDMWLEEIRPSRFVIGYELLDGDQVASRARSVCVPFDLSAGRPRRLTRAEREYLAPWLDPGPTTADRP
ncbi:MAG: acyl-CoA thioester hydrolase [Micromonosporaceae bacterium]|nr:acyl-CoA thioester hydrolase [Micromonosporaceae bacterium]